MNRPTRKFTKEAFALQLTDDEETMFLFYLLGAMEVAGKVDENVFDRAAAYVQKKRGRK